MVIQTMKVHAAYKTNLIMIQYSKTTENYDGYGHDNNWQIYVTRKNN